MNVSCPECSTVYRIDPNKVPHGGVRARCSTCNGVISVGLAADSGIGARRTPSDPIGDAFAPRPAPFIPTHTPRQTPRVATPPTAARVATPPARPRIPTPPVNRPVSATPTQASNLGASLPPLRPTPATPRTPWQPMTAVPAAPAHVPPVSVPPVTPPSPSTCARRTPRGH